jgi:hypothetical protein
MIRTLAVNCAPIRDCSQDAGKTVVETASDEMVMGAVQALCEFSILVSQQNDPDLSIAAHRRCTEAILQQDGCLSRSENVEVCEGQSGSTIGKIIPSFTKTKDL